MVIAQSTRQPGEVRLVAESVGLETAALTIQCERTTLRPTVE
jgi:hypothetical protein